MPQAGQDQDVDLRVAEDPEQVLEEDRIAARRATVAPAMKNCVPKTRSKNSSTIAAASTGTNSTFRIDVSKKPPHRQRHAEVASCPGARSRITVVM